MNELITDVQIIIFSFLQPNEIISFYNSCNKNASCINQLCSHPGFIVKCQTVINDNTIIEWFRDKNIQLHLLSNCMDYESSCISGLTGRIWYLNGKQHRDDDLPAVIWSDGSLEWYQYGRRHRDNDQPAFIHKDGRQEWYQYGLRHRDNNQPAYICEDGEQRWYRHGKFIKVNYKNDF